MFSALREGNILHLLLKEPKKKPVLRTGTVMSVSSPAQKNKMQYPPEMVVGITANFDGETVTFSGVPAGQSIYQYQPNMVIADSNDDMRKEVEALYHKSKQILDDRVYHEGVVESCGVILKTLDPQYAQNQRNEERFTSIEGKVDNLCNSVEKLVAALNAAQNDKKKS